MDQLQFEEDEIHEFISAMKRKNRTCSQKFEYSYAEFKQRIFKIKEQTTASP